MKMLAAALTATGLAGCVAVPVTTARVYDPPVHRTPLPVYEEAYSPPPRTTRPAPVYVQYGTVRRIDVIETYAQPSGGGAALGAIVGGVVGNQIGSGGGRAAATVLGVFGGALAGDQIERNQAAAIPPDSYYRVVVDFDNGSRRHFDYRSLDGLRSGERVRLQGNRLTRA